LHSYDPTFSDPSGGSIGTGLFVGSGSALRNGGPGGVLIAWILIGIMLINVTQALGEMAILFPVSGGFYTLAGRFLDPSFAFSMGWNYVFQWAVVLPLEITVAGTTVSYWTHNVPIAAWITLFWLVIGKIRLILIPSVAYHKYKCFVTTIISSCR